MFKLVLFYCFCQLVIQTALYIGVRKYIKNKVYSLAYTFNWTNNQIIKRYNLIGLVINSIITAIAILVTARASMVGTANLLASTILTVFIYLDSLVIAFNYKYYKANRDLNKKPGFIDKIKQNIKDLNEPIVIPAFLVKGDNK